MFKTPNNLKSQDSPGNASFVKTVKSSQNVPKDLVQFLARQVAILKDISSSISNTHEDIVSNRLNECIHLMEKKFCFALTDNPEQYHDYIQDFYENQINSLRSELSHCKISLASNKKQLETMMKKYENVLHEKQSLVKNLESSRINTYSNKNIQNYQENSVLKKELDHCRVLLDENNNFIEQQARALQSLSVQLKQKQKQHRNLRQKYEQRILAFDELSTKQKLESDKIIKQLSQAQRLYTSQLKDLALSKLQLFQERGQLQQQLEMKVQEIQLLTKRIMDNELLLNKLQRTLSVKQSTIQQLYQQIETISTNVERVNVKEMQYQNICVDKSQQIIKLQERLKIVNETNEKLQRKINSYQNKIEELQKQIDELEKQIKEERNVYNKIESQNQLCIRKAQTAQKNLSKILREKQRLQKQLKLMQQKYGDLVLRTKQQKQSVKNDIMGEINQLVDLVQRKDQMIKGLTCQRDQFKQEVFEERQKKSTLEIDFDRINGLMTDIQKKMDFLQNENAQLNQTKCLLEKELLKISNDSQKLAQIEHRYECVLAQKNKLLDELDLLKRNINSVTEIRSKSQSQFQQKQSEMVLKMNQERKDFREQLAKKDFTIKQMETKMKIMQQQLRDASRQFQNQKFKMLLKIKQLQQLLKERYEYTSRISAPDERSC